MLFIVIALIVAAFVGGVFLHNAVISEITALKADIADLHLTAQITQNLAVKTASNAAAAKPATVPATPAKPAA